MKAFLIDASFEAATEIRALLEKKEIFLTHWLQSGTGWVTPYAESKCDLVLVDWMLPKRDGLEVLHRIRSLDPAATVIFMHSFEGHLANELEVKAYAEGATCVVQKPIVPLRWQTAIDRILSFKKTKK